MKNECPKHEYASESCRCPYCATEESNSSSMACSIPIFNVDESPLVYGDTDQFSVYPYAEDGFIALVPLVGGWFVEHCVISDTGQLESSDGQDWGYSVFDVSHWLPLSKLPPRN